MASSLLRRGLRLVSPTALLLRQHHQLAPRLPLIASSSSCLLRGAPAPAALAAAAGPLVPAARFASSAAYDGGDVKLKQVLVSEIACAEEDVEDLDQEESSSPENFPFMIIDNPGDQTITLRRKFDSETVEVSVLINNSEEVEEADKRDEDEDEDEDEEEETGPSNISLVVTVDKGKGNSLEFCCTVNPDEINIDSLNLKSHDISDDQSPYEGPEFTSLDENLQEEFYKFLERRGIKPSMASFLLNYMIKKEEREYIGWLKNMKEFIEK